MSAVPDPSSAASRADGLPPITPDFLEQDNAGRIDNTIPTAGYTLLPMVGIGGSAGSIVAMQAFFRAMPADSGMAFVVIMHLSPDRESSMAALLGHVTRMPVVQAVNGQTVEADHVYIIPPGKQLVASDGHLELADLTREAGVRVAVDLFFRSLADSHGPHARAIVLSGADGDGAIGIKRIKERGGLTIAQDPDEAEHSSMPRSAIATGMVDWVLPAALMPARLLEYQERERALRLPAEEGPQPAGVPAATPDETESALRETLAFLHARTGRDFSYYKRATIVRRVARRMQVNGLETMPAYLAFLRTTPGETGALLQDLLISVTNFFRDRDAFAALEAEIPKLFVNKGPGDFVRVWVPACATGEEAYSIALLLMEHAHRIEEDQGRLGGAPGLQVFASDLDEAAIETARAGIYPNPITADVSEERLRRFFVRDPRGYRVRREVREIVLFAAHDLLKDAPFSRIDLVSCRNLLIYLNREAQARALDVFHFALRRGGLLFLGGSESVEEGNAAFATVDKHFRLYSHQTAAPAVLPVPMGPGTLRRAQQAHARASAGPVLPGRGFDQPLWAPETDRVEAPAAPAPAAHHGSLAELHFRLIERFSTPSVIVNASHGIVHLSENAGRFLHFTGGQPTTDLLQVVHPMLRVELRAALFRAAESNAPVAVLDVPLELDGARHAVTLRVAPAGDLAPGYLLVVFEARTLLPAETVIEPSPEREPVVRHLERELVQLSGKLRDTVEEHEAGAEELKASNEELQAMNEELRAATEELETGREELQSINEELSTVNGELKARVDDLGHANSDLHNLMAATAIATVFIDRELRVMRFTPSAVGLFHFIASDVGRPLSDLQNRLDYPELVADAGRVLAELTVVERMVGTADGRWFLTRLLPYRTTEDFIGGVVLTFVDITARRRADEALRVSDERLRRTFEVETVGILYFRRDGTVTGANPAFQRLSGFTGGDLGAGRVSCDSLTAPEFREVARAAFAAVFREGRSLPYEKEMLRADGTRWWALVSSARLNDDEAVKFIIDLSARKAAEKALAVSEERFRQFAENSSDVLWIINAGTRCLEYVSPAVEAVWGEPPEEILGNPGRWTQLLHPDDVERATATLPRLLAGETLTVEYRIICPRNGSIRWVRDTGFPIRDTAGTVVRAAGIAQDITEEKKAGDTLARSEATLRLVLENARDYAIFSICLDRKITSWNAGAQHILGYTPEEVLGMSADIIFTPEDLAANAPEQEADTARRDGRAPDEREHVRKDRSRFWASGVLTAMRDPAGEVVGYVKIFRDQTEARTTQEAMERSREQLMELLEENRQARADAEAASQAKDQFFAVLSHELRTPLTPVLMAARTLARRRDLPEPVMEGLAMIARNVQLEAGFIDDLLDLTRIGRGRLDIVRAPVDLHEVVRRAVEVSLPDLEAKEQRFELSLEAPESRLEGDANRLQQVLWNLLKNAAKFTPENGEIRLRTRAGDDADAAERGTVVVEVSDTGIGIEAEAMGRIFTAFEQADAGITRQFGGLGLGLAISQATVDAHGGTLQAASPGRGHGATFTVRLPLAGAQTHSPMG